MSISAQQISFRYPKGPLVLDGISCSITPGAITAIVGPNGSGKSTLIRLLAGLRKPESGQIMIGEADLHAQSHQRRAQRLAFIEQRPSLAFDFEVRRVVEFGGHASACTSDQVQDALERFELTELAHTPFGHLSVGQQQRVSIARAWVQIASNPTGFLLADEPCSAMDPRHAHQTMIAFQTLAEMGVGVGVVIHDLSSAARWSRKAIVLDALGHLAAQGPADKALNEGVLSRVFEIPIRRHELVGSHPVLVADPESAR